MILSRKLEVFVLSCALVALGRGLESKDKSPCELVVDKVRGETCNCAQRNLTTIVKWPEEISKIDKDTHLTITFFNNSITNLTELEKAPGSQLVLNFKANRIKEIVPSAFANLDRLVFLDLSNNNLTGQVLRSEIFQGPYISKQEGYANICLEKLFLSYNDIHSLDYYFFKHTPNLTILYLDHNPIQILDHVTVSALSSAKNLKILDLSYTDIDSLPDEAVRGLTKLTQIDLSGNNFITVPDSLKLVGRTLEYLTFNNNPIVELNDDSFVGLTALKQLEVGDNDFLEEVTRNTFTPLTSLKELHLCHNRMLHYISHKAFGMVQEQWTLKEVYLDDNNLSELSPDLMPWSQLEILGMTGNNWLCNCDLIDIVTTQGGGQKFKKDEVPFCAAPVRLHGEYLTNIKDRISYCPKLDDTFKSKKSFSLTDLKPKHVLWSIVGVALIVVIGMLLGLLVNSAKAFYNKKIRGQPIRYVNLNENYT